jgi:hypothetical protein
MNLAIMMNDKNKFKEAFEKADKLLTESLDICEEKNIDG